MRGGLTNRPVFVMTIIEVRLNELACLHNNADHWTYHIKKSHTIYWQHFDKRGVIFC